MDEKTLALINREWQGMPEFVQEDLESKYSVTVHFLSISDMAEFSRITGLKITEKTKGVFFPPIQPKVKKVYIDEP